MDPATSTATSTNDQSTLPEIFALSDEQILDIAPEKELAHGESQEASVKPPTKQVLANRAEGAMPTTAAPSTIHESQAVGNDSAQPPPWLAAQMQDPWGGEEAREFWDGVQHARSEAAAYRAAFPTPEDARALKELYPGGVSEARAVAERARMLDDVDRAYFGLAGNSPEQTSASRAQLAQRMLREDPAAFREMVEAGIKVLQEAAGSHSQGAKTLASAVSDASITTSPVGNHASVVVAQHAVPLQRDQAATADSARGQEHVAAYAAFERAANEDLERSVGGAIERTLAQALPVAQPLMPVLRNEGAEHVGSRGQARSSPLQERLATGIRAEVEKALQGDRQLGEQVAQILAARRFDDGSRVQIVRLISDRAQQLVPSAAKRVLNEWTQTTLAAHRGRTQRADATSARAEVASVSPEVHGRATVAARPAADEQGASRRQDTRRGSEQANTAKSRPINYRKLSDEQILDM